MMDHVDVFTVDWLLQRGISPNLTDREGNSWLSRVQLPKHRNSLEVTRLLLSSGADVNVIDACRCTRLYQAVNAFWTQCMLVMFRAGANPDICGEDDKRTVREIIKKLPVKLPTQMDGGLSAVRIDLEMRMAFEAWEANNEAHNIIKQAIQPGVRPL